MTIYNYVISFKLARKSEEQYYMQLEIIKSYLFIRYFHYAQALIYIATWENLI